MYFLELHSKGSTNIVKVLAFIFEQCVGLFTMLLVEGFSERGLFRYLSKHVFWSPSVQRCISDEGHLLLKMFKIESKFRKCKKKSKKVFGFWDNCILKWCNKLPLLRREYLACAVSGLKNIPLISNISQRDSSNAICLHLDQ